MSVGAQAQLSYSGGTDLTSFSNYNPTGPTNPQSQGIENALISAGSGGILTATFLGYEALDTDTYSFVLGDNILTNKTSPIGSTIFGPVAPGALDFSFADLAFGQTVGNGGNAGVFASYAVLGTFDGAVFTPFTAGGQYSLVLGL